MTACRTETCTRPPLWRGLCTRHYRQWLAARPLTCNVDDCGRSRYARGLCVMHYERVRTTGDIGEAAPRIAPSGTGHVNAHGYRIVNRPDHPLGARRAQHHVEEHRVVLYDAIGPGPHACHWCGCAVDWFKTPGRGGLVVDHLDENRLNNNPENLMPSCLDCNTSRPIHRRGYVINQYGAWPLR